MRTRLGERLDFITCSSLSSTDDRTGVSHSSTRWSGPSSDESDNGFVVRVVRLDVFRGVFLHRSTNLTDEDNTFRLGVGEEHFDDIDVLGTWEGVSTDTDSEGLTEAGEGGLAKVSTMRAQRACIAVWSISLT